MKGGTFRGVREEEHGVQQIEHWVGGFSQSTIQKCWSDEHRYEGVDGQDDQGPDDHGNTYRHETALDQVWEFFAFRQGGPEEKS